jgi:hypothetical protein
MKTDPTPAETLPDTISPEDVLTIVSENPDFARFVVNQARADLGLAPTGQKEHHWAKKRRRADEIRAGKIKASEGQEKKRAPSNNSANRPSFKPLWDAEQLRLKLQSYDRTPFLDILAIWMECAPTPQTIMAFADKYPDRWTKALLDLGRLGGFAEKREIDISMEASIRNMSDSQIEDQLRDAAYKLGIPLPRLLEATRSRFPTLDVIAADKTKEKPPT